MAPLTLREIGPIEALSPLGASRDALARLLPAFEPGELLGASVQRRLGDGSFTVELQGQLMRMALPEGTRTGDRLTLAFLGDQPRLTFLLKATQAAAEPVPQLSAIGRQVAALMAAAVAPGMAGALPAAVSNLPALLGSVPADGVPLAATLGKCLAQSGLFYEAHQAQWAAGQRSLAQLRLEPQAQLAAAPLQRVDQPVAGELPALARALEQGVLVPGSSATMASALSSGAHAPTAAERIIHSATLPLVQQQLGALESGRVAVQVEVWPQQWMQWDIEEQAPRDDAEPQAQAEWRTRLRLDLPLLGAIDASLTLRADGLHVLVEATDNHSAKLLLDHRASLQQALEDAGLTAASISVGSSEKPLPPPSAASPSSASPSSPSPSHRRRPVPSPATSGLRPQ